MISLSSKIISLPFPQRNGPSAPDLDGDGRNDYITATSWDSNSSNRNDIKVALQDYLHNYSSINLKITGYDNQINGMFPRDILYSDFNNDGIVDLFPVDAVEIRVPKSNGNGWNWKGVNQYAYISTGVLSYEKVQVNTIEQSSHTAAFIFSADGPPAIVYNTLGNSASDVPSMTINRYQELSNSFALERVAHNDSRLLAGNSGPYDYVQFFSIMSLDINNDGSDDLIGLSSNDGDNMIFINDGLSQFSYFKNFDTGLEKGYVVEEVVVGDYNGDGLQDALILGIDRTSGSNSLYKTLRVLISDGVTLMDETDSWLGNYYQDRDSSFFYMEPFDFNSDGLIDVAFAHFESETSYAQKSLEVLISTGSRFEMQTFTDYPDIRNTSVGINEILGDSQIYSISTDIVGRKTDLVKHVSIDAKYSQTKLVLTDEFISIKGINTNLLIDRQVSDRVHFSDKFLAFDFNENSGKVVKILGAVFGKSALENKTYVGIGLDLLDRGMTYEALAGLALGAAKANTAEQIVSTLWTNVVGNVPSVTDKAPFIKMLEDGMSPGALAQLAADTSLNLSNINLVGLSQVGIEYLPVV